MYDHDKFILKKQLIYKNFPIKKSRMLSSHTDRL